MAIDLSPAPFTWGAGGARMTPEAIASQRKVAQAMMQQGMDYSPVQSPWQGAARVAQAMLGGLESGQADAAAKANADAEAKLLDDYFSGRLSATPTPAVAPATPAATAAPMGAPSIPITQAGAGPVVPNDNNAMPGTVGMNQRLADLTSDFLQDHPGLSISSGFRSNADQQRLYDNRASNPNPVAVPGTSRHERGMAVDIGGMNADQRAVLPQYGLGQPVANDPPHVELAPNVQVASNDPAALPVNAQAAQGFAIPGQAVTPQAAPGVNPALVRAMSSPYVSDGTKKILGLVLNQQMEAAQKAADPLHQAQIQKATQDATKSDWEWKPYGRDANGNWTYAWVNSKTQDIKGRDGQPIPTTPKPAEDPAAGLMGEDYLKAIPRDRADIARKVANGEIDVSSLPNRGNYRMQVLSDASRFDPTFNPSDYKTRLATRKDFTSGKSAQNITSFNTAIGHLDSLDQSIDNLGNRGSSWYNAATAPLSTQTDPKYQVALKDFRTSKQAVIDELTRAFRGSGGSVHDLVEWEKTINETESPVALHAATRRAIELLRSRIDAVGDQYNRGMGKTTDPIQLLSPKAQKTLERLEGGGQHSPSAPNNDAVAAEMRRRGLL